MKKMLISVSSMLGVLLLGVPAGVMSAAEPEGALCSNRTLHGAYVFSVEGSILPSRTDAGGVLRAVALTTFDGKGGLTQVDHYVVNGAPQTPPTNDWPASTGTYTVNPDCTGKLTLNVPNLPPFVSHFIVTKSGKEIRTVLNANSISSVGMRIE